MGVIDEWEMAADHLRYALAHLKRELGKPGHKAAKKDFDASCFAFEEVSGRLPDA
jgi:3-methyladenine DNA glycosylase AlkC